MTDMNYTDYPWKVINSYFRGHHLQRLVRHHTESYNNLVNYDIEKTIDMFNPVLIRSPMIMMRRVNYMGWKYQYLSLILIFIVLRFLKTMVLGS